MAVIQNPKLPKAGGGYVGSVQLFCLPGWWFKKGSMIHVEDPEVMGDCGDASCAVVLKHSPRECKIRPASCMAVWFVIAEETSRTAELPVNPFSGNCRSMRNTVPTSPAG